jgi:transposase
VIHGKGGTKKIAPEGYEGSMKGEGFEKKFEYTLFKKVQTGSTILMDRTSFHRKKGLEKIWVRGKGNVLLFPVYAADFNPIEKDWANKKYALRDTAPVGDLHQTAIYHY